MNPPIIAKPKKRTMSDVIFGMVFFLLAGLIIINLAFPNRLVSIFGYGVYRVKTNSMEPTLMVNDFVVVEHVEIDELNPDDIIVFKTEAQLTDAPFTQSIIVIHYYSHTDLNGHVLTFPAANHHLDADDSSKYDVWGTPTTPHYVLEDDIIGRHIQTIASASFFNGVSDFFKTPWPYLGLTLVAGGIIFAITWQKKTKSLPHDET